MQLVKSEHGISSAPSPAMTVSTALCRARSGAGERPPLLPVAGWLVKYMRHTRLSGSCTTSDAFTT
eukprot:XP_001706043.1 Hypothetical protein GL50803_29187 [Giardia lamblia ATCC 50803]